MSDAKPEQDRRVLKTKASLRVDRRSLIHGKRSPIDLPSDQEESTE